jgi:hypothetical protein
LKRDPQKPSKILQPIAPYVLKPNELNQFMGAFQFVKVPTYYCGAIGKYIMDKNLGQ